jgi:hypothetical protein
MTRRMTLLVLALLGLMVLVVSLAPPRREPEGRARPAQTSPEPTPPATLTDPDAFDVEATLSAGAGQRPRTIQAELGDRVQITVQGDEPDSVMLGELDTEQVEPGLPARFHLLAETPGSYPLILESADRRIGTLEIR